MTNKKENIKKTNGLTIEIGRENQYVVEDITKENINSSFFAQQYRESLAVVESYLKHLPAASDKHFDESVGRDYENNIIAFVGDRGSGKTSCMESVAKFLSNPKKGVTDYKTIASTKFYALDLIDPAFFDEEHNIVSLVVATMYKSFTKADKELNNLQHDDNIKLYHQFAKVQNELEWILDKSPKDVDELDKLTNLSNTVSLKHDMLKLVNLFLRYMGKEDGILLLRIDDIDLNTQCADKMMESIRKYLILPNILILMSAKVEQLENVKQLAYVKEYKSLLDKEGRTGFTYAHINEMVEKFITKFLPQVHRVHMPILGYSLNSSLSIIEENGNIETFERWQDSITNLIFKNTGLLFYNDLIDRTKISRVVPTNLRELCQLVSMLYSMNDEDNISNNADKFLHYYNNVWAKKHLSNERLSAIQEITDLRYYSEFNKNVIRQLCKVYNDTIQGWEKESTDSRIREALLIVDKFNQPDKITLGDVFGVISLLEEVHTELSDKDFFFLIKAYYTFLMSRMYQWSVSDSKQMFIEANGKVISMLNPFYMPLIGGNFINSNIVETIAPDKHGNKRSFRDIYMKNVSRCITELRDEYSQFGKNKKNEDYNKFINKLYILEIIVLCLGRNVEPRYDSNFRKIGESEYFGEIGKRKRVHFDVNAYMYNVLDIENAYERVGNDLKKFVKDIPDSMYCKLRKTLLRKEQNEMLRIAIDAETIINLTKKLSNYRTRESGFINNIMRFFERMSFMEWLKVNDNISSFSFIGSQIIHKVLESVSKDIYYEEYANKIFEVTEDDAPKIIIEDLAIKENQYGKFQSNQIKKAIEKKYTYYKREEGQKILKTLFPDRYSFSKDEIKKKVEKYNKEIKEEE